MERVVETYGYPPKKGFIRCPFHHEDTASLKLYRHSYYCFGCGAGGDVIDFTMRLYGLNFKAACDKLAMDFGLSRVKQAIPTRPQQSKTSKDNRIAALCAEHRRLWRAYCDKRPQSPNDAPCPEFVEALQKLDYIEYLIEEAERDG